MRTGQSHRQRERFAECGAETFVRVRKDKQDIALVCNHCHNRWCDPCQRTRAKAISDGLADFIKDRETRFVTLTQRASVTPLRDQIDAIYRDFSTLRRRKWWQGLVSGGAAFLECKIGANSGLWHVHLHILCEGKFMPQKELSDEWYKVTGASFIVDVRPVPNASDRARYVTKYVTKPADASVFANRTYLDEMVTSLKGRRLCFTFGTWRGLELDPHEINPDEWDSCGSLETVVRRATEHDEGSVTLLQALVRKYPNLVPTLDALNVRMRRQVDTS